MARVYNRKEGTIEYAEGVQKTLELSRNYHVLKYIATLKLEVTNGATPVYYDDNLFRSISTLTLVANGSLNIKQIPAEKLLYNSLFDNGRILYTDITKTASGTFIQTQVVEINLIIPNEIRPLDTIFNTKIFNTLNLNVTWADSVAIGSGVTIVSGELHISSHQLVGYQRNANEPIKYYKEVASQFNVTANNNNYLIKLDPNQYYLGFLIAAKKNNVLDNTIIKNLRIKSGTTVFMDLNAETMQRLNEIDAKTITQGSTKGLYYLDFTPRNRLSDMLNTVQNAGGFNTLELELDVTNTNASTYISVFPEFVEMTGQFETK
jgi:hypothetical protein